MQQLTIGAYRIVRPLGTGGMGEVYQAYDERLGRLVALKRVRRGAADSEPSGARERFRREARAAAQLNHPYIVQIHDLLEDPEGDGDWLVMEHVEGRSIRSLLGDGPLAPELAVRFAVQIAQGLDHAHRFGLVHRDLKAANVVVGQDGRVRILDFGLATKVRTVDPSGSRSSARPGSPAEVAETVEPDLTHDGAVIGSFGSMAPEQARGEPVDGRADLFSLGVLLYEMLAGRPPFRGKNAPAVLQALIAQEPNSLADERPGLPAALVELVHRLLAKMPTERPHGATLVVEALRPIAAELPPVELAPLGFSGSGAGGAEIDTSPTGWSPIPTSDSLSKTRSEGRSARRVVAWSVVIAVLMVGLSVFAWLGRSDAGSGTDVTGAGTAGLRVAVLPLDIQADVRDSASASSQTRAEPQTTVEIVAGLERGLLSLSGITPVESTQIGGLDGSVTEIARAVAADQVITAALSRGRDEDSVFLKRIDVAAGSIVWTERVPLPPRSEASLITANALVAAMRRAFPEATPRPGFPNLDSRPEDYADLLRIRRAIEDQQGSMAADLESLEALSRRAPGLIDAHVLSALTALSLHQSDKQPIYLERARGAVERARAAAPDYPPLLRAEIRLAIAEGETSRAEALFDRLERLIPGDSWIPDTKARLRADQGRLDEAAEILRLAVDRHPTWRHLARLADLESELGNIEAARLRFEQALELVPASPWLTARLARLELLFGDLGRAEALYGELAATNPHRSDLTNLGLVHYLRRDFDAAAATLRQALEMAPGHLTVTLNLADAEAARGHTQEARRLYSESLAALDELAEAAPLAVKDRTIKAQCLLGLGRETEALSLVETTLQEFPGDAEVLFHAALIFARSGLNDQAIERARDARSLGLESRWLSVPGFDSVRADPAFASLLEP